MIEEPSYPLNDPPEPGTDVENIISQLKLLYFIGGEETVRLALTEAGVEPAEVDNMVGALRNSVEDSG